MGGRTLFYTKSDQVFEESDLESEMHKCFGACAITPLSPSFVLLFCIHRPPRGLAVDMSPRVNGQLKQLQLHDEGPEHILDEKHMAQDLSSAASHSYILGTRYAQKET